MQKVKDNGESILSDRMPGYRFLTMLLNKKTRDSVDLTRTKFDRDKLEKLVALYDACGTKRMSVLSFIQRSEVRELYGLQLANSDRSEGLCNYAFYNLRNSQAIPERLLYDAAGKRRSVNELRMDPEIIQIFETVKDDKRREKRMRVEQQDVGRGEQLHVTLHDRGYPSRPLVSCSSAIGFTMQ